MLMDCLLETDYFGRSMDITRDLTTGLAMFPEGDFWQADGSMFDLTFFPQRQTVLDPAEDD